MTISFSPFVQRRPFLPFLGLLVFLAYCGTAQAWWDPEWTIRKKITIDTTAKGGDIADPIGTSAILVRLHDGNFQFDQAKEDASDIRFVLADDKTLLPYHIEKFDSLLNEAFVWVKVPDVKPSAQTSIWMYYGNTGPKAENVQSAKGTYDADTVLVDHFNEHGVPPVDSTASGNVATNAGTPSDGSIIGTGLRLLGRDPIAIPASPSLNWIAGGSLTWSAWVKPGAAVQPQAILFSRVEGANGFTVGLNNGTPYVEISGPSGRQRAVGAAPLAASVWKNLAVVVEAGKTTLYVDGVPSAPISVGLPALTGPLRIGGDGSGTGAFVGEMDELEISRIARPPGFIKLTALGQGPDGASKLLNLDQDESAPAGWLSGGMGLFGTLIKSVTIDGWVIIGVLMIMSVISWIIMVTKYFYLNKLAKGAEEFLREWGHVATDLTLLDHTDPEAMKSLGGRASSKSQKLMLQAPIYHIYKIGSQEISHRLGSGVKGLSARSMQAIRASLDGGYVREGQALNSSMVLLTIAIAGGPYLGLLGTVVGVMITFAQIAASGEVNINAIAPGIAAALIATVAGLLVAIPALFGYNYLNSRIKEVMSTMHMFIDEFVTKMAEFYPPPTE